MARVCLGRVCLGHVCLGHVWYRARERVRCLFKSTFVESFFSPLHPPFRTLFRLPLSVFTSFQIFSIRLNYFHHLQHA